jgi:hypothetical protein
VLTLASGIGGTTTIFWLIHSLSCARCRWLILAAYIALVTAMNVAWKADPRTVGHSPMRSYLRFKVNLPEFGELAAIQAGLTAMSVRGESERVAKPLPTAMRAIGCHDTGATRSRNLTHRRTA